MSPLPWPYRVLPFAAQVLAGPTAAEDLPDSAPPTKEDLPDLEP